MSDNNSVPKHLAIIMDGNGRWALEKHLDRSEGHIKGYQNIKSITLMAKKLGVKYLTLFAFSTENWNRPLKEVNFIMNLALEVIIKESEELSQNNINITHLGDKKNLSTEMIQKIKNLAVLGSTGSIGKQTIEVVLNFPDLFNIMSDKKDTKKKGFFSRLLGRLDTNKKNDLERIISNYSLRKRNFGN